MKKKLMLGTAVLVLASAMLACGDSQTAVAPTETNAVQTEAVVETETEVVRIQPNLPEADFGGSEFRVLHWFMDGWESRVCRDIVAESENGDVMNDAVYKRNLAVTEKYNFTISLETVDFSKISGMVSKAVKAGEDAYDLVYIRLYEGKTLMTGGYYMNFNNIPNLDMSQPWWDAGCVENLTVDGKLYFAASAFNIEDKNATASILFNKAIASNYDVEDLYALVRDGKWTFDKMREIYSKVTTDVNGDGAMDEEDLWGFLGAKDVATSFYLGGEGTYLDRKQDGSLVDSFNNEHNIAVTQKIQSLMCDKANFYNHHTGTQNAKSTDDNEYRDLFSGGHGLFFWSRMDEVTTLRSLETDFGILPTPKYDEAQENYCSLVSQHITGLMTVPATASNLERTGIILEALSAESLYTVQPAYYDTALKSKYLRDDDSAEMLDIIFNNRVYDFGEIFDLGGWASAHVDVCISESKGVASSYEKYVTKIEKALDKMLTAIGDLD